MTFYQDDCLTSMEARARAEKSAQWRRDMFRASSAAVSPPMPPPAPPPRVAPPPAPLPPVPVALAPPVLEGEIDIVPQRPPVAAIIRAAAAYFEVSIEALLADRTNRVAACRRQIAMYVATSAGYSLPRIGLAFSRDHTTVLFAERKIRHMLRSGNEPATIAVKEIMRRVGLTYVPPAEGPPPDLPQSRPARDGKPWEEAEIERLTREYREHAAHNALHKLAADLGRTRPALYAKAKEIGLMGHEPAKPKRVAPPDRPNSHRRWSAQDDCQFLAMLAEKRPAKEIAHRLGRSAQGIRDRARSLGHPFSAKG